MVSPSIAGVKCVRPSPCPAPTSLRHTFLSLTVSSKSTSSTGSLPVFFPNNEQPESNTTHSARPQFKDQFATLIQMPPARHPVQPWLMKVVVNHRVSFAATSSVPVPEVWLQPRLFRKRYVPHPDHLLL